MSHRASGGQGASPDVAPGLAYGFPKIRPADFPQGWSDCVSFGNFEDYRDRFESIQKYFAPRFPEATRVGNEMIKTILEKTQEDQVESLGTSTAPHHP